MIGYQLEHAASLVYLLYRLFTRSLDREASPLARCTDRGFWVVVDRHHGGGARRSRCSRHCLRHSSLFLRSLLAENWYVYDSEGSCQLEPRGAQSPDPDKPVNLEFVSCPQICIFTLCVCTPTTHQRISRATLNMRRHQETSLIALLVSNVIYISTAY